MKLYRAVENIGTRLLGMFVPRVKAEAACGAYYVGCWSQCWQCNFGPCCALCRENCGCADYACG
ncbi:hypothetical protein [Thermostaphylospora chromogena]|uniref:Uncharacterized protein n=1 Tax=Thermostaphylospora chromogena TaxID=35622 RepID=A0A1H1D3V7_9ACTN|nr:hypothetical protein [Thermostaphylospora chromogena]SDQ71120.1 hypothetical protein SAMN04489764_1806 [Thermostaphylospora chromogena]